MSRKRRDFSAERAALQAAAARLLAGIPLRSATGRLTVTELITEAGLRRDLVYSSHKEAVDEFTARVKAQSFTPQAMSDLARKHGELKDKLTATTQQLDQERHQTAILRRTVAELTIELDLARQQLETASAVTRLPTAALRQRR